MVNILNLAFFLRLLVFLCVEYIETLIFVRVLVILRRLREHRLTNFAVKMLLVVLAENLLLTQTYHVINVLLALVYIVMVYLSKTQITDICHAQFAVM